MSLTVFSGLPGSGKSKRLIETVLETQALDKPVVTILSSDSEWITGYDSYSRERRLGCRAGGVSCDIDYFIPSEQLPGVLQALAPGTIVAIDEAQMFGPDAAHSWLAASRHGLDLLLVSPSATHLSILSQSNYNVVEFQMTCERCRERQAHTVVLKADGATTVSMCNECFETEATEAKKEILDLLIAELPHRGSKAVYQPVHLAEASSWPVSRPDSERRAEVVIDILREVGVLDGDRSSTPTYIDLGCSTGYFCHRMQGEGMYAMGVDAVEGSIAIARQLESYVRRPARENKKFVTFEVADVYDYLRETTDDKFDVVSAFSVLQWVMTQRPLEDAMSCFQWMFEKSRRVAVLEMGYSSQDNYAELLPIEVDRTWVENLMKLGDFDEVRVLDADEFGVMRDLFIGIRA